MFSFKIREKQPV